MIEETPAQKLAITQAIMMEVVGDFEAVMDGVTEHMPHCWEIPYAGVEIATVVEYVRHLEAIANAQNTVPATRHHPECDGTCHINPCPLCAKKENQR